MDQHDFATTAFRRRFGVTPSTYRRDGPPTASLEGPAVGHAATAGMGDGVHLSAKDSHVFEVKEQW